MSPRNSRLYLDDILAASRNISVFLVGVNSAEDLDHDLKTFHAVIRNIEIIGEACRQMPRTLKARYSQIPWQKISNMRNVIAHEYFGVDAELVWQVCQKSIPALEEQIKGIYDDFPQE
jgi:uncharacterized protein with HEPN domain